MSKDTKLLKLGDSQFIEELLEILPIHVFWKDRSGVYLGCNSLFAESVNLSRPEDVIGKTDYELPVDQTDSEKYRKDDMQVMENNRSKLNIVEEQLLTSGNKVYLLTSKVPLHDKSNQVIGILGIYSNITNLKETQEKLAQAKEKAEIANEAKSEFIANMSHDVRTPITGILGLIDRIKDRHLNDPETLNDLDRLSASTQALLRLLNEIIDVVEIESGKMKKPSEKFNLKTLVKQNIDLQLPRAEQKNIKLSVHIDENVPTMLFGPRFYLDRIILNVLSNAVKFTHEGGVELSVTHTENKRYHDKITLIIEIKDTGIGIPEDQFEVIFEHFSRLQPAHQGTYEGSGLGLHTVKRYIDSMKGSINVTSEVGKGSTFTIMLPFQIDHEKQPVEHAASITSETAKFTHNPSILVVEDQMIAATSLEYQLEKLGISQLDIVKDGKTALEQIQKKEYDLIFMDIGLPDMTGTELTQKIRQIQKTIPIVALTGHAKKEIKADWKNAGIQDVYTKPINYDDLKYVIKKYTLKK